MASLCAAILGTPVTWRMLSGGAIFSISDQESKTANVTRGFRVKQKKRTFLLVKVVWRQSRKCHTIFKLQFSCYYLRFKLAIDFYLHTR